MSHRAAVEARDATPESSLGQEPLPVARAAPVVTVRAILLGGVIGLELAIANVYVGLKMGWWESGAITASVLVFTLAAVLPRGRAGRLSVLENGLAQTVATAAGAMPATTGLLGALPALVMLGARTPSGWGIAAWGLSLGVLGLLLALALRRWLLVDEGLAFPTGVAAAAVISTLHASSGCSSQARAERSRTLLGVGWLSMAVTWLRDAGSGLIPQATFLPGTLWGTPASALTLGIGWSPMLLAIGTIAGPLVGLSLLVGALLAWGGIAPLLARAGLVKGQGYREFAEWLAWPGIGLMTGAAVAFLGLKARFLVGVVRDLRTLSRQFLKGGGWVAGGALVVAALVLVLGRLLFGLSAWTVLLALVLVVPLGSACTRAAGQTDVLPAGPMGQITQVAAGAMGSGPPGLDVAAGSVVAGALVQTGTGMWSFKTGRLLGLSVHHQFLAQLLGVFWGAAVIVPVYALVVATHSLGTDALPAPSAIQFKAIADLVALGAAAAPPLAVEAALFGFVLGSALTVAARGPRGRFLPSAAALGLGFLTPAHYAVTICLGALVAALVCWGRPAATRAIPTLAAGAIAGESIMSVIVIALAVSGLGAS